MIEYEIIAIIIVNKNYGIFTFTKRLKQSEHIKQNQNERERDGVYDQNIFGAVFKFYNGLKCPAS